MISDNALPLLIKVEERIFPAVFCSIPRRQLETQTGHHPIGLMNLEANGLTDLFFLTIRNLPRLRNIKKQLDPGSVCLQIIRSAYYIQLYRACPPT